MSPQPPSSSEPTAPKPASEWTSLGHGHLPLPTFWPSGLALAVVFVFWGLITSWVVMVVGLGLFIASMGGWIRHLRYERKHHP